MKSKARFIQLQENIHFKIRFLIPIAFLIASCGATTPEPVPSEEPSRSPPAIAEEISEGETSESIPSTINSQPFFVPGEVIVMGDQGTIRDNVANIFTNMGLTFTPNDEPIIVSGQAIYLFSFDPATVQQTILVLNELESGSITVDPNYLTGLLTISSCGDPIKVDGVPFEFDGSPFEVAGSPFEVAGSGQGSTIVEADPGWFEVQWAWKGNIEGTFQRPNAEEALPVVIFDTDPFSTEAATATPDKGTIQGIDISVHRYINFSANDRNNSSTLKDHAAFIAGLVNHGSPTSSLHMVPVLNDDACGDLFKLLKAMDSFLDGDFGTAIYNLSLGIQYPGFGLEDMDFEEPPSESARGVHVANLREWLISHLGEDTANLFIKVIVARLETLEAVVKEIVDGGNTIVAAAGNDSIYGETLEPNLPAAFEDVIGVGANTSKGEHACYSNSAEIYAPGGNGSGVDCLPVSASCTDADCPYGVISWSMMTSTGYRFWSGTSFATAIVSGLIANPSGSSR